MVILYFIAKAASFETAFVFIKIMKLLFLCRNIQSLDREADLMIILLEINNLGCNFLSNL